MELTQPKEEMVQQSAVSYLDSSSCTLATEENILPEPPAENSDVPMQMYPEEQGNQMESSESNESDWMSRMEQNN